jgi:hypothetical protein
MIKLNRAGPGGACKVLIADFEQRPADVFGTDRSINAARNFGAFG